MGRPRTNSPSYWAERKRIQRERMKSEGELEQVAVVIPKRDHEKLLRYAAKLRKAFEADKIEAEQRRLRANAQADLFPDD